MRPIMSCGEKPWASPAQLWPRMVTGTTWLMTMDYSVWASRFGQSSGAGAAGLGSEFLSSAVPEPAGFVLTLIAAIMGCSLRRR